ncbi:MAG: fused MFS/spermidine synthase [Planctomycetes bacterium]|nr:fused MFS/spermidine synthase [Planctomycetota bacterium]
MQDSSAQPDNARIGHWQRLMMAVFAATVFVGAFLLFQVQPLIGKFILPWFGGSPEVWTTCMLFFQVLLLAGYAYAHLVVTYFPRSLQATIQIVLLVAAVALLPILPAATWKPDGTESPMVHILLLLTVCVGLPYFILSATGPLIQGWFGRTLPGKSPYRLYSLSNAASLLALLSYPLVVEPLLARQTQAQVWGWGLTAFALLSIAAALLLWTHKPAGDKTCRTKHTATPAPRPDRRRWLLWLALPAGASVVLLAVTNKICQDITVVPLFWVLPLAVYLLSFIICFHSERWYVRNVWVTAFILSFIALVAATSLTAEISAAWYIFIHTAALFTCCMVFHGELYAIRPDAKHLTGFYLMIATGGALGGFFVVVVAPLIFNTYFELYVGLLMCCLFVLLSESTGAVGSARRRVVWICLICIAGAAGFVMQSKRLGLGGKAIAADRNFFGILTVWEKEPDDPARHHFVMQHGMTNHGLQFTDPARRTEPAAYFSRKSGVGLAMQYTSHKDNRRVGIIGLGVGTIAAYARQGDHFTFYEINPQVEHQAREYFTYLADCKGKVDVILGDARLTLERLPSEQFDLLVLDAFTGDAVPVHLLTKEAFDIYLKHLNPNGLIAMHISTNHVDLQSVVRRLAAHFGLSTAWIETHRNDAKGIFDSDWIILARNKDFQSNPQIKTATTQYKNPPKDISLWTDNHANLLQVLK